ncbi:MAG: orotidine 5'-phosphate decarboxylase [Planctomycetota bacterium]|nr:orotidine 5'-phosphate decarboxylase [Planctomycetota bacterium]
MAARLQLALDQVDLHRALRAAREGVAGGVTILEVGTPLLKAEGLGAVRAIRAAFPRLELVCDGKTMDAGRLEFEAAAKAGATMGTVLGVASDSTLAECVEAGRNYGIKVLVDLLGCVDPVARAKEAEALGADAVNVHCPIDEQVRGGDPFETLRAVRAAVSIPVTVAGGITAAPAPEAVRAGADVLIVGGAITKARDAEAAARGICEAMVSGKPGESEMAARVSAEADLRRILTEVSTANISDAMHRAPCWPGMLATHPDLRVAGPAVTCRAMPGDWAKPVEAIDTCQPGDVLVIDSGGVPPAVWGELATNSAINRGLAGVIVHGAVRDTRDIRALTLPVFSRAVSSHAGEPKGFGEIGVTLRVDGIECRPGDWIVADADGVMVLPRAKAVELANRAMYCLEAENRIRSEIMAEGGGTLAQVVDLYKWEKRVVGGGEAHGDA